MQGGMKSAISALSLTIPELYFLASTGPPFLKYLYSAKIIVSDNCFRRVAIGLQFRTEGAQLS